MPIIVARKRSALVWLWQHLPWTFLFWASFFVLILAATVFGVVVEVRDYRLRNTDIVPVIRSGDTVQVVVILDGDQFVVEKDNGKATIRMLGVKTFDPVINEFEITAFGRAAIAFGDQWLLRKPARVLLDEAVAPTRDVRGRFLAYFEREGVDLNRLLVEEGLGIVYTEYPFAREATYLSAERLARKAARGLWGSKRATARATALRREWSANRRARDGKGAPDPLFQDVR